jgi:hypothetical protein
MMGRARVSLRTVASVLLAVACWLATSEARAYCRSTTCRQTADELCDPDDNGCPTKGKPLFWTSSCIGYALQKDGTESIEMDDVKSAITKAFQAWNDVECPDGHATLTLTPQDDVACHKSQYNPDGPNVNVVLFQDNDWTYHGVDGTLAKTQVTFNEETGEIYDADIEVNAAFNALTVTDEPAKIQYDLQAILTHEVGHFIGLGHSPDSNASMYASYAPGSTTQRNVSPDDAAGMCDAYPPNRKAACNAVPRGGFASECVEPPQKGVCTVTGAAPRGEAGGVISFAWLGLAGVYVAHRARRKPRKMR